MSVEGNRSLPVTTRLCQFLASTKLEDIPDIVLERSAYLTLDGLACALVGAHLPWSVIAVNAVTGLEGSGPAPIIGWGRATTPTAAALLNSTFIQGFELDDFHEMGPLHSASVVLPAALATQSILERNVSGSELALAIALGFEVGPRLGVAMRGHQMVGHGWHSGAVYGGLAAAVACAKLRQLGAAGFEDAISTAGTQASGLMSVQFESMLKRMNHGFGARNGVLSAALAEHGFTGVKEVIERPYGGFISMFADDHPTDAAYIVEGLGERWELESIIVKPYASGGTTHPIAEAMLRARNEFGMTAVDVENITIRLTGDSFKHNGWKLERPITATSAQLNVAYVGAIALLDGEVFVSQFSPGRINADDVWSLIERIDVIPDPDVEALAKRSGTPRAARVSINRRSGSPIDIEVLQARGTRRRALTNREILDKYSALVGGLIGKEKADGLAALVLGLRHNESAGDLLAALSEPVGAIF